MAPKKQAGTAVAQAPQRSVVPGIEVADEGMLAEMEGMAGVGQSTNPEDRGTPFLFIAQKSSRAMTKQRPEFIQGLEVGNLYNTITGEFWSGEEGIPFIPCFFKSLWNEWTPQDDGGGFHGSHAIDTQLLNGATPVEGADGNPRRDIYRLDNGHELVLTHEYWGVLPDSWTPIIAAMSSTNLGASKKMQGLIGAQKVQTAQGIVTKPSYFTTFRLKTAYDSNDSGDWYKFIPSVDGPTEDLNLRNFCKALAKQCIAGTIKSAEPVDTNRQSGNGTSAID